MSDVCRFCNQICENKLDQIRKLPKILKSVKIIHHYSFLFIRVLNDVPSCAERRRREVVRKSGGQVRDELLEDVERRDAVLERRQRRPREGQLPQRGDLRAQVADLCFF